MDAGAAGGPAAGGAVRLGADPAGRRGYCTTARRRRGIGRGHADRPAGAAPVGREPGRQHPRHRLLRAVRRIGASRAGAGHAPPDASRAGAGHAPPDASRAGAGHAPPDASRAASRTRRTERGRTHRRRTGLADWGTGRGGTGPAARRDDRDAGTAALRAHRLARGERLPARAGRGPADRAAVRRVQAGVHAAEGNLPGRRGAHDRGGRAARHRDRDHVLRGERGLPGPARHAALCGGGRAAGRGRTSPSSTSSWAAIPAMCGWACGSGRCGNGQQERGTTGAISHFAPTGEPDAPYETYARQL